ncbi:cytochrome c1 [Pelagibacteraceae bacterium]|jgi:ubiquinol-cytochrome c reductase cytochrome c1 subunit|nr:cytochrome c1 [Pelagibacteraceae bacterium]|tara:strand:- start:12988 stop:13773 length:786 start_codon:yes stop_codon:yes gene_type:complete
MIKYNFKKLILILILIFAFINPLKSAEQGELLKVDWSFKGLTGKFDRASLQRGFQIYKEVCSSCHSMQYLSYRNLGESGGPEFSELEVKAIAASIEIDDGPDSQGEMFTRPGRPSDKFKSPYPNVNASTAANGGAYPPDMSVLVKARPGGSNYIYSVLMGYEEPPAGMVLDDGVYYNKYMIGNKIKMSAPLSEDIVEYSDGTNATVDQMAKDVTTFLSWTAEPELEERHKTGVKVIIYLILLTILVYLSMKKIWSRIDSEV